MLDETEFHHEYHGKMKLEELVEFARPFALSQEDKKQERVIDSK